MVPSEKELVGKLKALGELNRYFAAVTPGKKPANLPVYFHVLNQQKIRKNHNMGRLSVMCRVKKTENSFSRYES